MYNHRKKTKNTNIAVKLLAASVIALLIGVAWLALSRDLGSTVIVNDDEPVISQVAGDNILKTVIDEPLFRMQLPADWVLYQKTADPLVYYFKSTKEQADDRTLALHIDNTPTETALNKMIPLTAQGNKFLVGSPSDNCANFTNVEAAQSGQRPPNTVSKWQNISFLCNLRNQNQNAIGTSSSEGINKATLEGPTAGPRSFFFLYIDHNNTPDQNIITDVLRSFEVK